eukprot:1786092-Prorocentrum_lima.AAC.1
MRANPELWTIYELDGCPTWADDTLRSCTLGPATDIPALSYTKGMHTLPEPRPPLWPKVTLSQPVANPLQLYAAEPY